MSELNSSDILHKLDKLQLWKNEQKLQIKDRQQKQTELLNLQHQEMYDILNLSKNKNSECKPESQTDKSEIPKRPFLKRNQGLKKRFNIDPEALRLNNLPQYKFQNAHRIQTPTNKKKTVLQPVKSNVDCPKNDILDSKSKEPIQTSEPISWAKVLDPTNLKPLSLNRLNDSTLQTLDESDNLSIFELLEQQSNNSNFQLTDTFVRKWIESKTNDIEDDGTVAAINEFYSNDIESLSKKDKENLEDNDSSSSDNLTIGKSVHFSNEIFVNEIADSNDYNSTSTPNNAKQRLSEKSSNSSGSLSENENTLLESDSTSSGNVKERIIESSDFLMERLKELEEQIDTFKKSNRELTKEKQDHDLKKAYFEEEKTNFYAELNEDRKKMKHFFDQEQNKIDNERVKLRKIIEENNILKKEKEQNSKLKKEIIDLNAEIKSKEIKHTSAQSRLRSQNKNLEKTIKELNNEIDSYKQKLKMVESENMTMIRGNNTKILQEINRNIAKISTSVNTTQHIVSSKIDCHSGINNTASIANINTISKSKEKQKIQSQAKEECIEETNDQTRLTIESSIDDGKDCALEGFQREIINPDGSKDIWYPNGNLKKISSDEMFIKMFYFNKDIKETNINEGTIKYYYSETKTWHTTYIDGLEIIEFPNGHTEHRHKDGTIEIHFPNGAIKTTPPKDQQDNKLEEWKYPDGTTVIQLKNGDKILKMLNGQKEIHTKLHKRREYPDGTVKLLYPDGSQETRYSNGRVRLKDKEGNLILDSEML